MIASTYFLLEKNFQQIENILKEKLLSSLNRAFDGTNRQPLYKIFYGLHHNSTDAWVRWIKSQNTKKQERAFRRLADHLQEPPKELGLITKEVVHAVVLFEHDESFEILENLLINSRKKWGAFKSLKSFYELAAIGLVEINAIKAEEFLLVELENVASSSDADTLKVGIISAITKLPNENKALDIFRNIVLDYRHSFEVKLKALSLIEEAKNDKFAGFLEEILRQMLASKNSVDFQIFDHLFARFLDSLSSESPERMWDFVTTACIDEVFCDSACNILAEKIEKANFYIDGDFLIELFSACSDLCATKLTRSLCKRFKITNEEQSILESAEEIINLNSSGALPENIIDIKGNESNTKINEFLQEDYLRLEKLIFSKGQKTGIKLITGDSENEKYFLVKAAAANNSKTIISINTKKMILSPDKLEQLESIINEHKPCLIYLNDIQDFLEGIISENRRSIKLLNICNKYFNDSRVNLVAALNADTANLRDDKPELYSQIKDLSEDIFAESIEIESIGAKKRKKIFYHYEMKLDEDREVSIGNFNDLLDLTDGFTSISYLQYLLRYMKLSLLSHGKLIPFSTYNRLVGSELNENSLSY